MTTSDGGASWRIAADAGKHGALSMFGYGAAVESTAPGRGYLVTERDGLYVTTDGWRSVRELLQTDDEAIMTGTTWPSPAGSASRWPRGCCWGRTTAAGAGASCTRGRSFSPPRRSPGCGRRTGGGRADRGRVDRVRLPGRPGTGHAASPAGARLEMLGSLPHPAENVIHRGRLLYALTGGLLAGRGCTVHRPRPALGARPAPAPPAGGWRVAEACCTWSHFSRATCCVPATGGTGRWSTATGCGISSSRRRPAHGMAIDASGRIVRTQNGGLRWTLLAHQPEAGGVQAIAVLGSFRVGSPNDCASRPCRGVWCGRPTWAATGRSSGTRARFPGDPASCCSRSPKPATWCRASGFCKPWTGAAPGGRYSRVMRRSHRNLIATIALGITAAAVIKELRTPRERRTWHGKVAGAVPYDFRKPTPSRLRERLGTPRRRSSRPGRSASAGT